MDCFITTWCTMYTGYPNRKQTDQGPIFISQRWKQRTDLIGVTLRISGVKAHSSIGIEKRLYEPLRKNSPEDISSTPIYTSQIHTSCCIERIERYDGRKQIVTCSASFGHNPTISYFEHRFTKTERTHGSY